MESILRVFSARPRTVFLIAVLIAISTFAGEAEAMFVSSAPGQDAANLTQTSRDRVADLARIRAALESRIVRQKLMDLGLSTEEATTRVNKLSDEQVHQFASRLDSLQAGGRHGDSLIILLLVLILLILII